ncbi:hypothetical protein GQ54DRAFT_304504 [Martensiomyces pterosporus]|nr:hypothetical protein GQ54DRAFT_304504 [Martensiomyces pterosporus]
MAATAPSYVIRYFDTLGLAETSRYLLTAAKVNWTEENPEWPQEKPNQPFGRLPVLVETSPEGGEPFILSESLTIERYLARKYGFLPVDDLKASARQEQIRDQETDVGVAFFTQSNAVGDAKKELTEKFHDLRAAQAIVLV